MNNPHRLNQFLKVAAAGTKQRLRLVAVKNHDLSLEHFEIKTRDPESGRERYPSNLVLDLDYTVLIPKRS